MVPTSTIQLAVTDTHVLARVDIPLSDLEAASGLDLGDETQADIDANAATIKTYLLEHFTPTSDDGTAWTVSEGAMTVGATGNTATTGIYDRLETTFTLTPPAGTDATVEESSFDLGYDAIVEKVATHVTIVTVSSDATDPDFSGAYEVGTVRRDTVTNQVEGLHVDLGSGTSRSAFLDMVRLRGAAHPGGHRPPAVPAYPAAPGAAARARAALGRRRWGPDGAAPDLEFSKKLLGLSESAEELASRVAAPGLLRYYYNDRDRRKKKRSGK